MQTYIQNILLYVQNITHAVHLMKFQTLDSGRISDSENWSTQAAGYWTEMSSEISELHSQCIEGDDFP